MLDFQKILEALALKVEGLSDRIIADRLGVGKTTVNEWVNKFTVEDIQEMMQEDVTQSLELPSTLPPNDIEQYVMDKGFDLALWEISKVVVNEWGKMLPSGQRENGQRKAFLKPKAGIGIDRAIAKLEQFAPNNVIKKDYPEGDKLGIVALYDSHFGKYCWGEQTGTDYDLNIARDIFNVASSEAISKLSTNKLSKILLPIGSDLLHIDNKNGTTTGGTQQDYDTRLEKIFDVAQRCCIDLITKATELAPVHVVGVGSNHDRHVGYYLCQVLKAWFRNNPNVTFDVGPKSRKYFVYGKNLIGMCHGDGIKPEFLARLIMGDNKDVLANIEFMQWLTGHFHKSKQTNYLVCDTLGDIELKVIPSLCGTDSWHFDKGYVAGNRACKVYLYDYEYGPETEMTIFLKNLEGVN